jgi:hypothetical protein
MLPISGLAPPRFVGCGHRHEFAGTRSSAALTGDRMASQSLRVPCFGQLATPEAP